MDSHTAAALKKLNDEALAALEAAAATCSEINDTLASIGLDSAVSAVQKLNDDALAAQRAFRDEIASMAAQGGGDVGPPRGAGTAAAADTAAAAPIDTYIDERRSYCQSCDTYKKGVQWWTVSFQTRKHPLFENADGTTEGRWVHSACKSCMKHVPKRQRDMKPAW